MVFGKSGNDINASILLDNVSVDEKWRGEGRGGSRRGARARKEVLINNSRWWRIRKRVKSIGVMTRGKAEAKYFPNQ